MIGATPISADLAARQSAKFGNLTDQGGNRCLTNARYAIEQRRQISEVRLYVSGHVTTDAIEFCGQRFDDGDNALRDCSRRLNQPVTLGD